MPRSGVFFEKRREVLGNKTLELLWRDKEAANTRRQRR
jgi:hypothetical protein